MSRLSILLRADGAFARRIPQAAAVADFPYLKKHINHSPVVRAGVHADQKTQGLVSSENTRTLPPFRTTEVLADLPNLSGANEAFGRSAATVGRPRRNWGYNSHWWEARAASSQLRHPTFPFQEMAVGGEFGRGIEPRRI